MEFVSHTANGKKVFLEPLSSHATIHLQKNPNLLELLQEALPQIAPETDEYACTFDFGREVGTSDLVILDQNDRVVYAKRRGRKSYTKFVIGRKPSPATSIALILEKDPDKADAYLLWSAWIGVLTPSMPGSGHETENSRSFWKKHALVYDASVIVPGTKTEVCPW